jgi:hypothetical protein
MKTINDTRAELLDRLLEHAPEDSNKIDTYAYARDSIPIDNLSQHSHEWLRTMYTEAWGQYIHEDNLSLARNNLFITIQGAGIGILAAVAIPLIQVEPIMTGPYQFYMGHVALGIILIVFSILGITISKIWSEVTTAGEAYLRLRFISIKAIEDRAAQHDIGLASLEVNWEDFLASHPNQKYYPFSNSKNLRRYSIPPRGNSEGWLSIQKTIKILIKVWFFLSILGILLIFDSIIFNILG